jgi:hypothetical protein
MGQGITGGTRKILAEAIQVMPPEEWKVYCVARLNDEFKASPNKFFLEDGWRRYQDKVKDAKKEKQYVEEKRKEAEERRAVRPSEPPEDFKEFVRNFKKK